MRLKSLVGATVVAVCAAGAMWAASDPVLMTINGKPVRLSEFEYLYNKNMQQQENEESIDQYVDRFVNYKLKVADAEAECYDTIPRVKREIDGYRKDILAPFLTDTVCRDRLVDESYDMMANNIDISHIMLPLGANEQETAVQVARMDSIRQCALAGENFEELAMKHSVDRSKERNHGRYGYVRGESGLPYSFEKVAWNTPTGEISKPFRTDFGVHMVKVNDRRPDEGKAEVQHILLLYGRNATDSVKLRVKFRADSIYEELRKGASFEEMVSKHSDDVNTRHTGGRLRPFGVGQMVPKFQQIAFSLNPGEISEPFEMDYGCHIIKKVSQIPLGTRAEERANLLNIINSDERSQMPVKSKLEQVKKQLNVKKNPKLQAEVLKLLNKNGGYNQKFVTEVLAKSNLTAFTYAKGIKVPVSKVAGNLNPNTPMDNEVAAGYIVSHVDPLIDTEVMQYYTDNLFTLNPDFRNLYNEYRDGTLLYEVSQKKVWNKATMSPKSVEQFYNANPEKYGWQSPHFKAIIVYASDDSILNVAKQIAKDHEGESIDSIAVKINKQLRNKVRMERMLAAKGENPKADYLGFGGPEVASSYKLFPCYFALGGKVLTAPEGFSDVKGDVTSDYQDALEKEWVKELRNKYKVKIDNKVLDQARKNAAKK